MQFCPLMINQNPIAQETNITIITFISYYLSFLLSEVCCWFLQGWMLQQHQVLPQLPWRESVQELALLVRSAILPICRNICKIDYDIFNADRPAGDLHCC